MYFKFTKHRKIFYGFSGFFAIVSLASVLIFGLNLGIDFTGGSVLQVNFAETRPSLDQIREALVEVGLGDVVVQTQDTRGLSIKTKKSDLLTRQLLVDKLQELAEIEAGSESFESIGPVIGNELKRKTNIVIILALLSILAYIAFSFRKISRPVKSYVYGLTSLLALFHDVAISLGVFTILGRFYGIGITIPIVTAFLTVVGYSINDSVVVFDRVRENLLKSRGENFEQSIDKSLNQSLTRSINTSFTTMIVLFAIFFFGGSSLKFFSLALILGVGLGTYSSLFLATPLLISFLRFKERKFK